MILSTYAFSTCPVCSLPDNSSGIVFSCTVNINTSNLDVVYIKEVGNTVVNTNIRPSSRVKIPKIEKHYSVSGSVNDYFPYSYFQYTMYGLNYISSSYSGVINI